MRLLKRSLTAAVLLSASSFSIPVAIAQNAPPSPNLSAPESGITDQKLDAVAAAYERVSTLQRAYRQRLAEAGAPTEQERITNEANNALTKAVTDQGLSLHEYTSILQVAQNDQEIRAKILQRVHPSEGGPN